MLKKFATAAFLAVSLGGASLLAAGPASAAVGTGADRAVLGDGANASVVEQAQYGRRCRVERRRVRGAYGWRWVNVRVCSGGGGYRPPRRHHYGY